MTKDDTEPGEVTGQTGFSITHTSAPSAGQVSCTKTGTYTITGTLPDQPTGAHWHGHPAG